MDQKSLGATKTSGGLTVVRCRRSYFEIATIRPFSYDVATIMTKVRDAKDVNREGVEGADEVVPAEGREPHSINEISSHPKAGSII
jgi:hypothetical protein